MLKLIVSILSIFILFGTALAGGLEDFLANINVQAKADLPGFSAKVSAQFGVSSAQVQSVIKIVNEPADAFMVFQLGQMSRKPTDTVVQTYKAKRGGGWGAMAKELGIKPGSAEFHALKRGDFALTGAPDADKGKAKGKGKGHNK